MGNAVDYYKGEESQDPVEKRKRKEKKTEKRFDQNLWLSFQCVDTYDDTLLRNMIDDNQILTDAERLEEPMGKMISED